MQLARTVHAPYWAPDRRYAINIRDGVDWARTHGADVINLSLGGVLTPEQIALFQPTFSAARAAAVRTATSNLPRLSMPALSWAGEICGSPAVFGACPASVAAQMTTARTADAAVTRPP